MNMEKLIKLLLAFFLFGCLINMPYGYYQFVRFSSMVAFAYLAYSAIEKSNKNATFIYIGLAILFQPVIKIALGRIIWNIVDVIVGIGLIFSVLKGKVTKN